MATSTALANWAWSRGYLRRSEAGKQAMQVLMQAPAPPDAIIFANDNLAAGGLLAGQRAELKIPQA